MAQFTTKCPHCGAELSVADEWVGMEVECPACGQPFAVREDGGCPDTENDERNEVSETKGKTPPPCWLP